jgi:hypothetical protein
MKEEMYFFYPTQTGKYRVQYVKIHSAKTEHQILLDIREDSRLTHKREFHYICRLYDVLEPSRDVKFYFNMWRKYSARNCIGTNRILRLSPELLDDRHILRINE